MSITGDVIDRPFRAKARGWHIDSWDARGGYAFASFFKAGVDEFASELPTIFVSPPAFAPEAVADRAMAFAASHGSFQEGFFLDGVSVAFPNLPDLVTFVRRVFLSGGGGDAGGDGPPPEPEGGPEEPEIPPSPEFEGRMGDRSVSEALRSHCARFSSISDSLEVGSAGANFSWENLSQSMTARGAHEEPLVRALLLSLFEILRRSPRRGSAFELKWFRSIGAWCEAVRRLYLQSLVFDVCLGDRGVSQALERITANVDVVGPGWGSLPLEWRLRILMAKFDSWFAFETYHRYGPAHLDYWAPRINTTRDLARTPFDSLWRLPLPKHLRGLLEQSPVPPQDLSLGHLLSTSLASPPLLNNPATARDAADLVLFAAAVVAAPSDYPTALSSENWLRNDGIPRAARVEANAAIAAWLTTALPQIALPARLETLIRDGMALAYA
jgi:hypothetical protein